MPPSFLCFLLLTISNTLSYLTQHFHTTILSLQHNFSHSFSSPTLNLELLSFMPPSHYPRVDHPQFTHISSTQYIMKDPVNYYATTIHVGHIVEILKFNEQVHLKNGIRHVPASHWALSSFQIFGTQVHTPRIHIVSARLSWPTTLMNTLSRQPQSLFPSRTSISPQSRLVHAMIPSPHLGYRLKSPRSLPPSCCNNNKTSTMDTKNSKTVKPRYL